MLRYKRSRRVTMGFLLAATAFLLVLAAACSPSSPTAKSAPAAAAEPKNIIILFADGTGGAQFEVGRYANRQLRDQSFATTDVIFRKGSVALMTTHAADTMATDSAAAGTAMSIGAKTKIGTIGMTPDGKSLTTVMEAAKAAGKRIGLVTTATVYDATPAAFSVHTKARGNSQEIVDQYLSMEPDVILGGGRDFFLPKEKSGGKREDGKDVMAAFAAKDYQVATNAQELSSASGPRLLGLFSNGDLEHEIDRVPRTQSSTPGIFEPLTVESPPISQPSVAEMAVAAIRVLSQNSPNGFVLLIETENTDTASHRNDIAALIRDLWVFDEAVKQALEFQRKAPETLLIVTGDHETGGLSVTYARKQFDSRDQFYAAPEHLVMASKITISLNKASQSLGSKPSPEAVDKLVATHFPGFRLDNDLKDAIVNQKILDLNFTSPTANALGRMVARQTGFYWGTAGHSTDPVVVGAMGPGAEAFKGYLDNTEFAGILHKLLKSGKPLP